MAQYKVRGGSGLTGPEGVFVPRGLALSGLANDETLSRLFDDFLIAPTTSTLHVWSIAGTGPILTQVPSTGGGIVRMSSTASAGTACALQSDAGLVSNVGTQRWYYATRFAVTVAIDAQTTAAGHLFNFAANKSIGIGVFGASSTVNFVLQYDGSLAGTFVDTGVAINTNQNIFEMWGDTSNRLYARVNNGTIIGPFTMAAAPADACYTRTFIGNGSTAAIKSMELDWKLGLAKRT